MNQTEFEVADSVEEAFQIAGRIGYPVCMRIAYSRDPNIQECDHVARCGGSLRCVVPRLLEASTIGQIGVKSFGQRGGREIASSINEAVDIASSVSFPVVVRSVDEDGEPVRDRYMAYNKKELRAVVLVALRASPVQKVFVRTWGHTSQ